MVFRVGATSAGLLPPGTLSTYLLGPSSRIHLVRCVAKYIFAPCFFTGTIFEGIFGTPSPRQREKYDPELNLLSYFATQVKIFM